MQSKPMHAFKLAIIGGGNMGTALARSVLSKGIMPPSNLLIVEKDVTKCDVLVEEFSCHVEGDIPPTLGVYDVVILAVKPQDFQAASAKIAPLLRNNQIVLSIMAGITIDRLDNELGGHSRIVRSMPNLPFLIGEGTTVYIPSPAVGKTDLATISTLLNACGKSLQVQDEALLDSATAISGSGPGYVYYLIEHFMAAAVELGFTPEEAQKLVASTLTGSVNLWLRDGRTAQQLRASVTSPGGTTAAAVEKFESEGLGKAFHDGIVRACERSKELSGQ